MLRPWRQTLDFRGRATRREYWFFIVQLYTVFFLTAFVTGLLVAMLFPDQVESKTVDVSAGIVILLLVVLLLIPYLSASVRRIHDHDKSGWMFMLILVPLVGWIFYLIMMLTPGTDGTNGYGANPRDRLDTAEDVSKIFS
jgi:uncharacterized membrane protein YhaH (DUF805 family)